MVGSLVPRQLPEQIELMNRQLASIDESLSDLVNALAPKPEKPQANSRYENILSTDVSKTVWSTPEQAIITHLSVDGAVAGYYEIRIGSEIAFRFYVPTFGTKLLIPDDSNARTLPRGADLTVSTAPGAWVLHIWWKPGQRQGQQA